MRLEDELYFSSKYRWFEVDINSKEILAAQFKERITEFYIEPASQIISSNKRSNSFAAGLLLFAALEAIGRYRIGRKGYQNRVNPLIESSTEFQNINKVEEKDLVLRHIGDSFRNGLAHEGRVKNSCQFVARGNDDLFLCNDEILIINCEVLVSFVENILDEFFAELLSDDQTFDRFKSLFCHDFKDELNS